MGDAGYAMHGMDYMVYAHLQLAEDASAAKMLAEATAIRTDPGRIGFGTAFGIAAIPARLALERGRWAEAAKLETPAGITDSDWKRFPQAESITAFARAIGAARSGDAAAARREIERLDRLQQVLTERKLPYWASRPTSRRRSRRRGPCARSARMPRPSRRCARPPITRIAPRSTW